MTTLDSYAKMANQTSTEKGFWDNEVTVDFLLSKLALLHSEISETLEAIRKEKGPREVADELADVFIRLVDFYEAATKAGYIEHSMDYVVTEKMMFNSRRPRKHGVLA